MAKTIKFNIEVNGKKIANLNALQENFNVDDILEHFESGRLKSWLKAQEYEDELGKVESISSKDDKEKVKNLLKIFEIPKSDNEIKDIILSREYQKERQKFLSENKKMEQNHEKIISNYHNQYKKLIEEILLNSNDLTTIKTNLGAIERDFISLFMLNYYDLVMIFSQKAPLALLMMMGFDGLRSVLENSQASLILSYYSEDLLNENSSSIMDTLIKSTKALTKDINSLNENIKIFKRNTNGNWEDVVEAKKRVLILCLADESNVRSFVSNEVAVGLNSEEINGKFVVLDGLQFQANNDGYVIYLEV